jgi:hypothetical protein
MLSALNARYRVRILYAGLEEKIRFAKKLIDAGDVPAEVIKFALFDMERSGLPSIGANHNALLLHTSGDAVVSVDDDTVCQIAATPGMNEEPAFMTSETFSSSFPYELWAMPTHEAALQSVEFIDIDFLAIHERLLGKKTRHRTASPCEHGEPGCGQVNPSSVRRLDCGEGRVLISSNGFLGECTWPSPLAYMFMTGSSFERLISSETAYRQAAQSREQVRFVNRVAVTDITNNSPGAFVGLDNRHFLVPYIPVGRGEDSLYWETLSKCVEGLRYGHFPYLLLHLPVESQPFFSNGILRGTTSITFSQLISAFISSCEFGPASSSDEEKLRSLGSYLQQLGSMSDGDFQEIAYTRISRDARKLITDLEARLRAHHELPEFWTNDVRQIISSLRQSSARKEFFLPVDLLDGRNSKEARELTQRMMLKFGQLLYWWPQIVGVAQRLRQNGQRLAHPIQAGEIA